MEDIPNKAYSILSGGMDSTLATFHATNKYDKVIALFFDWGQKSRIKEWKAVQKICKKLHIKCEKIRVPVEKWDKSSLTKGNPLVIDNENYMVPERNLIFISLAASYARANGGGYIIVGFNVDDGGYDTKGSFVSKINNLFREGNKDLEKVHSYIEGTKIRLKASIIKKNKKEIREELIKKSLFDLTYSCYAAKGPCNKCKACKNRERYEL